MGVIMKKVVKNLFLSIFLGLFVFASTNLQGAKQKETCDKISDKTQKSVNVQVGQDLTEVMRILELRADAIFYAINESIERNDAGKMLATNYTESEKARKATRIAINIASNAYLMANKTVQNCLDQLEDETQRIGIFTYSDLEKIIADDVLKSERMEVGDFSIESVGFQFMAIANVLSIKDKCQEIPFLAYAHLIQESYTNAANLIKVKTQSIFLEELDIPKDNIVKLCHYLFAAHVRNIIDLAFNTEVEIHSSSVKYTSTKIEAHKKQTLDDITKEREIAYSKLISLNEIRTQISQQLSGLSEKLVSRILALTNPGNGDHLIHYVKIWGEETKSETESFKKIFSGIDLKNKFSPQNAQNIWPNLVAKLTECKFEFLIKSDTSAQDCKPGCSRSAKTASAGKKTKAPTQEELKADQAAQELIAQEDAAKKKREAGKQKTAAKVKSKKIKAVKKEKEKEHVEEPKPAPSKQNPKIKKQTGGEPAPSTLENSAVLQTPEFLLSPLSTSPKKAATPKVTPAEEAACSQMAALMPSTSAEQTSTQPSQIEQSQDTEIEEDCGPNALELHQTQWGEPANPGDQVCVKYNCIWDLSRLDLSSKQTEYQCKIFLHPETAGSSVNFLANLDYSVLHKYKNPRDNNHAFSNLVEKYYGQLGVVTKKEIRPDEWLELHIQFPGRIAWIGHEMADACQLPPNGIFEFIIIKKDMDPNSYALCVHRFFRPN